MTKKRFKSILCTNDDGIQSEGIQTLKAIASAVAEEVWIVAPASDQSGTAASINVHEPLRIEEIGPHEFAVSGSPCDSVIMGLRHVLVDKPPDMVLSGVNRGLNLADDVLFSGTANAALAATFLGFKSVAFSQAFHDWRNFRWSVGLQWGPPILQRLSEIDWPKGTCFNINFPDVEPVEVKGIMFTRQGHGSVLEVEVELRMDTQRKPYYWFDFTRNRQQFETDTDVQVLRNHGISITPLKLDRTDHELLDHLQRTVVIEESRV
jgi:5'-nucleotidase